LTTLFIHLNKMATPRYYFLFLLASIYWRCAAAFLPVNLSPLSSRDSVSTVPITARRPTTTLLALERIPREENDSKVDKDDNNDNDVGPSRWNAPPKFSPQDDNDNNNNNNNNNSIRIGSLEVIAFSVCIFFVATVALSNGNLFAPAPISSGAPVVIRNAELLLQQDFEREPTSVFY
jgi:hypothetical protein